MENMEFHYCKYCGEKIDDDSTFCTHCGKSVEVKKTSILKKIYQKSLELVVLIFNYLRAIKNLYFKFLLTIIAIALIIIACHLSTIANHGIHTDTDASVSGSIETYPDTNYSY